MKNLKLISGLAILCFLTTLSHAQKNYRSMNLEDLINQRVNKFDLSLDNQFKLAAYTELKGRYSSQSDALTLHFGTLGSLSFYRKNCLLRTGENRIYHLDNQRHSEAEAALMNERIAEIFENIILLGNHEARPDLVQFVDYHLSKKNIEPFDKIFLRHILIKYGRFNRKLRQVEFDTEWLPERTYTLQLPGEETIINKPITQLKIKLDEQIVRGYYIRSGGTVYVENVKRNVRYATGEQYDYNVSAFKLFVQKLFSQTTQYIVRVEQKRLDQIAASKPIIKEIPQPGNQQPLFAQSVQPSPTPRRVTRSGGDSDMDGRSKRSFAKRKNSNGVKPLYHKANWIPMMLGLLRANGVNVGDHDVVKYFINQPYFEQIYDQMTSQEKNRADRFYKKRRNR